MNSTGPTFSHVFGTNTTAFELLALKRKIMGSCWLEIKGASLSTKSVSQRICTDLHTLIPPKTSWCKIEFSVADPKNVNPLSEESSSTKETPPLTIMSISLRTIVNLRENKTELLCATTRTWDGCECIGARQSP